MRGQGRQGRQGGQGSRGTSGATTNYQLPIPYTTHHAPLSTDCR
ncbi:hypothetical protein [Chroococcidiopsis sp [FACHB-1243]]|nr:hypothetical protein [Chroococcidiopsis sp. [FACHB-1243]]